MSFFARRPGRLAVAISAALLASLAAWAPQAARADASALSITDLGDPTGTGTFGLALTGTAEAASYLFVFYQPQSAGPCLATPAAEGLANAAVPSTGTDNAGIYPLQPGPFSVQASVQKAAGVFVVCGYLEVPSTDPHQPGPRYATPAAAASHTVTPLTCPDPTFAITKVVMSTVWAPLDQRIEGSAAVTVTTVSPGEVYAGTTSVQHSAETPAAGTFVAHFYNTAVTPGQVVAASVSFFPEVSALGPGTCTLPDGSVVMTGPAGTYHPAPIPLALTWFYQGQGGTASIDGVTVLGSNPVVPAPLAPTPVVTGTGRVGSPETCTVPRQVGMPAVYEYWLAAGKVVARSAELKPTFPTGTYVSSYRPTPSTLGQVLRCAVKLDTLPLAYSRATTVALGRLTASSHPLVSPWPKAGLRVSVNPVAGWSAAPTTYRYQWYLGTAPISGATQRLYLIPKPYKGKKLSVRVTASAPAYAAGTASSLLMQIL